MYTTLSNSFAWVQIQIMILKVEGLSLFSLKTLNIYPSFLLNSVIIEVIFYFTLENELQEAFPPTPESTLFGGFVNRSFNYSSSQRIMKLH